MQSNHFYIKETNADMKNATTAIENLTNAGLLFSPKNFWKATNCSFFLTDVKYLKEEDAVRKTFTVSSTLDFLADRSDDGAVVSCRVDHESLNSTPQIAMQVLEIHCK